MPCKYGLGFVLAQGLEARVADRVLLKPPATPIGQEARAAYNVLIQNHYRRRERELLFYLQCAEQYQTPFS